MSDRTPRIFFVTYGGGHVTMVLAVMRAIRRIAPQVEMPLMALTIGYNQAIKSGETPLSFKDFLHLTDRDSALSHGRRLLDRNQGAEVPEEESLAYLGINYTELEDRLGATGAADIYAREGRAAFLPTEFMTRVIDEVAPDVVVATNTPRAEEAALRAATARGLPTLMINDLVDKQRWPVVKRDHRPDRLCVVGEPVRQHFLAHGFAPETVLATGNPAFDALFDPAHKAAADTLRRDLGWEGLKIILWAGTSERLPSVPEARQTDLPRAAEAEMRRLVAETRDAALLIRYHPSVHHLFPEGEPQERVYRSNPTADPIQPQLHASDAVIALNSTVSLEAAVLGKPSLSLEYTALARRVMSFADEGITTGIDAPDEIVPKLRAALAGDIGTRAEGFAHDGHSADRIAREILTLVKT